MPYDIELAGRIRAMLRGEAAVTERSMFGGLAFLVGGNMAVAANGEGGLLVRVDPDTSASLWTEGGKPMVMRGREMRGWLTVDLTHLSTPGALERWVDRGVTYARTLEAKEGDA